MAAVSEAAAARQKRGGSGGGGGGYRHHHDFSQRRKPPLLILYVEMRGRLSKPELEGKSFGEACLISDAEEQRIFKIEGST